MAPPQPPRPFLEVVVHDLARKPSLTWVCGRYESGTYRTRDFGKHLFDWLPEFALSAKEYATGVAVGDIIDLVRRSAAVVYDLQTAEEAKRRGEFGELLLHVILREVFGTLPAISKMYFKTASNDNVKGFDAVHLVLKEQKVELWLGEVKFYESISSGISAVLEELKAHLALDYLKKEFIFITHHLDTSADHYEVLRERLMRKLPLEEQFDVIAIPIVLTYDSDAASIAGVCADFHAAANAEVERHYRTFVSGLPPSLPNLRIHLILVPLASKKDLRDDLHARLTASKAI